MTSLCNLVPVVFLLCCSTVSFAQENSTFEQENNNTSIGYNITTNACKLHIYRSTVQEILGKHNNFTSTSTVKVRVSIFPGNNTEYSQEIELPWASEVGRAVISLV